jgi:hypothetical protein
MANHGLASPGGVASYGTIPGSRNSSCRNHDVGARTSHESPTRRTALVLEGRPVRACGSVSPSGCGARSESDSQSAREHRTLHDGGPQREGATRTSGSSPVRQQRGRGRYHPMSRTRARMLVLGGSLCIGLAGGTVAGCDAHHDAPGKALDGSTATTHGHGGRTDRASRTLTTSSPQTTTESTTGHRAETTRVTATAPPISRTGATTVTVPTTADQRAVPVPTVP